jgi:hypothetical protein
MGLLTILKKMKQKEKEMRILMLWVFLFKKVLSKLLKNNEEKDMTTSRYYDYISKIREIIMLRIIFLPLNH